MPDPLRVVLVAGPASGGLRGHVTTLARELAERGCSVTVVAPAITLRLLTEGGSSPVQWIEAPVGLNRLPALLEVRRTLRAAARDSDVVHAHGLRAGVAATGAVRDRPVVLTWHNAALSTGWGRRLLHRSLERRSARRAAIVLVVSPDLLARARAVGAHRAEFMEIPVRPLAPPTQSPARLRAELGVAADRPVVLAVARLEPQKRLDVLIDAAAGFDRVAGPQVLIAGDGPLRAELEARVRRASAPVTFLGWRADPADLLALADVAVLTSDWEGWPAAAVDPLRTGVPLVATDVGGMRLLAGPAVELVPRRDPAAVRDALLRLLGDPQRRDELRRAGLQRQAEWRTLSESVDLITTIYLDVTLR